MSQLETNAKDLELISAGVDALIEKANNPTVQTIEELCVLVIFRDNSSSSRPTEVSIGLKGWEGYYDGKYDLHGYEADSNYDEISLPANGRWQYVWENLFVPDKALIMFEVSPCPSSVTGENTTGVIYSKSGSGLSSTGVCIVPCEGDGTCIITYTADCYT